MLAIATVLSITTAGCDPNPTYITLATEHIAKGPAAACCTTTGGKFVAGCEPTAAQQCAFAKDAKATFVGIEARGSAARDVTFDLEGPNGKARCVVHMESLGGRRGGIRPGRVTCTSG